MGAQPRRGGNRPGERRSASYRSGYRLVGFLSLIASSTTSVMSKRMLISSWPENRFVVAILGKRAMFMSRARVYVNKDPVSGLGGVSRNRCFTSSSVRFPLWVALYLGVAQAGWRAAQLPLLSESSDNLTNASRAQEGGRATGLFGPPNIDAAKADEKEDDGFRSRCCSGLIRDRRGGSEQHPATGAVVYTEGDAGVGRDALGVGVWTRYSC